ncbi:hypothetical protein [Lactobacillus delbrueckii]|uniref:hypothetical protein n=1 Tax=Lactobacillus delbrueckii TaxID=1584 RepID=UPI003990F6CE
MSKRDWDEYFAKSSWERQYESERKQRILRNKVWFVANILVISAVFLYIFINLIIWGIKGIIALFH